MDRPTAHRIEIFRAGTHTDTAGKRHTFSEADLAAIVASYDRARHDAPVVVGHPTMDAPAYGWVRGLVVDGQTLSAELEDVDAAFAELVKNRRFKHVSAAFYPPDDAANPQPGQWSLRHVGFLGGQPPAVKGLKPAQFAAGDHAVTFMEPWQHTTLARLLRNMREWLIGTAGTEAADKVLPGYDIDELARAPSPPLQAGFAEPPVPTPPEEKPAVTAPSDAASQAEATRLAEERRRLEADMAAFAEQQAGARRAADVMFVEQLVADGRLLPALKADTLALLGAVAADGEPMVAFAEGAKRTPHAALRELLGRQPKSVTFGQYAPRGSEAPLADATDAADIKAKATAFAEEQRRAGVEVTAVDAVLHVMGGSIR
jgi:hypothetical protein